MSETTKAELRKVEVSRLLDELHACGIMHLDRSIAELLAPEEVHANGIEVAETSDARSTTDEPKAAEVIQGAGAAPQAARARAPSA